MHTSNNFFKEKLSPTGYFLNCYFSCFPYKYNFIDNYKQINILKHFLEAKRPKKWKKKLSSSFCLLGYCNWITIKYVLKWYLVGSASVALEYKYCLVFFSHSWHLSKKEYKALDTFSIFFTGCLQAISISIKLFRIPQVLNKCTMNTYNPNKTLKM